MAYILLSLALLKLFLFFLLLLSLGAGRELEEDQACGVMSTITETFLKNVKNSLKIVHISENPAVNRYNITTTTTL